MYFKLFCLCIFGDVSVETRDPEKGLRALGHEDTVGL